MPRAWRVAYVIGELGNGGAEYQLYELVRGLDRTRVDPTVLVLAAGGYWAEHIRELGVDVEEIAGRGSADLGRLRRSAARSRTSCTRCCGPGTATAAWPRSGSASPWSSRRSAT